ncbi:MAG: hypothetical protein RI601_01375 [Desulfurivibrionaceae bacterium]|nr:hypothetical protein [Desulfurivibrionaceae bacterium]
MPLCFLWKLEWLNQFQLKVGCAPDLLLDKIITTTDEMLNDLINSKR